MQQASIGGV